MGNGKDRCLFLQIIRYLVLALQVPKYEYGWDFGRVEAIPGESLEQCGYYHSACQLLIVSVHWRLLPVPEAQLYFLKITSFPGKSGVRIELQLYLHKTQWK